MSAVFLNAAVPLVIPTYDGSGQCVHPDVIELPSPLMDAALLMAFEPYPFSERRLENPSLAASDDGLRWTVPAGVHNPIVRPRDQGWHSDAALHWTAGRGLALYYRYNSGVGETTLFRCQSDNGVEWSSAEAVMRIEVSGRFASPSIVGDAGALTLVYVDTIAEDVLAMDSRDGLHWSTPVRLLSFPKAWHVAARMAGPTLYLLMNDARHLYLLRRSEDQSWQHLSQHGWRALTGATPPPILSPSPDGWDAHQIYRGSFLISGDHARLWYSARSLDGRWNIGYTDGPID